MTEIRLVHYWITAQLSRGYAFADVTEGTILDPSLQGLEMHTAYQTESTTQCYQILNGCLT